MTRDDFMKVIKGLECCAEPGGNCPECPYGKYGIDENGLECDNRLSLEALELLKKVNQDAIDELQAALDLANLELINNLANLELINKSFNKQYDRARAWGRLLPRDHGGE